MGWIWLSSNVKKFIKSHIDKQIRRVYRVLKKKIDKKLDESIQYDLRDAIRIEVKRATESMNTRIEVLEAFMPEIRESLEKIADRQMLDHQPCNLPENYDLTPHERLDELEKDLGTLITNIAETVRQNAKDIEDTSEVLGDTVDVVNSNAEKIEALFDVYNQYLAGTRTLPKTEGLFEGYRIPFRKSEEKSSKPMFRGTFFDGQEVDLSREDVERIMTQQQEDHLSNAPREQVLKMALDSLKSKHGIPSDLRRILAKRGLLGGFSVGTAGHPLAGGHPIGG